MIIINFKNYVHGKRALELAKKIEKHISWAIVCPSAVDLQEVARVTNFKVYAQHVDVPTSPTKSTGYVDVKDIKLAGARGSLVNHSEHQISLEEINQVVGELREANLKSIVCAPTLAFVKKLLKLGNKPDAIAFEDVELIATGKSITNYRTEEIKKFVEMIKGRKILPLCGAGIHSVEDVKEAKKLGCRGVLISSAVANVDLKKAERFLKDIAEIR